MVSSYGTQPDPPQLIVPQGHHTSTIFIDESGGTEIGDGRFFVMASVKVRYPGRVARAMGDIRDKHKFRNKEFHFNKIEPSNEKAYHDLTDLLWSSGAHIAATVVNKDLFDPFRSLPNYSGRAEVATALLHSSINVGELVSVLLDQMSSPTLIAVDEEIKSRINHKLQATSVVSALCVDSRTHDCLQLADLVASSVAFDIRRRLTDETNFASKTKNEAKHGVARRLLFNFGVMDANDVEKDRLNIRTLTSDNSRGMKPWKAPTSVPNLKAVLQLPKISATVDDR